MPFITTNVVTLVVAIFSISAVSDPTTQPSGPTLDPAIAANVRDAVAGNTGQRSDIKGGAFGKHPYEDISPDGVLIGFRIGLGSFFSNVVIKRIEPIYLTPRGEELGSAFGNEDAVERTVVTKAPPGYAVGAVTIRGGGGLDAITVIFMRFNGTRIDPTDCRVTPRIGGSGGGASLLDGDGTPVIGICGRQDDNGEGLGLGLIFIKPTAMVDQLPW
jgi:hypothetical protein